MRRFLMAAAAAALSITLFPTAASGGGGGGGGGGGSGGPITLMGIDADDGGHGDDSIYIGLLQNVNSNVNKSGSGIAVIGSAGGASQSWWTDITSGAGIAPTFIDGASAISSANFTPFRVIGVAGDEGETDGGLSQEEHDALSARAGDIQDFVRSGGGIFGLSSVFDPGAGAGPYAWIAGAAPVTSEAGDYDDVTPTPDGQALGINDTNLDVCCWHNTFSSFPSFLRVLAVNNESGTDTFGQAAALGGERVFGGKCPGAKNLDGNHIVGTKKKDNLKGTAGRDIICGLGKNDTIRGLFGNDVLFGGDGDDQVLGGHGNDRLEGEAGNDTLRGMVGNDDHDGGSGNDTCKGGRGKDSRQNCE